MAAETLFQLGDSVSDYVGFNGAAARWPRRRPRRDSGRPGHAGLQWGRGTMAAETRPALGRHGRNRQASMGPRHDGRGDRRSEPCRQRPGCCFNGAAARWPRRLDAGLVAAIPLDSLQWGRGTMAAETSLMGMGIFPPSSLQWGRGTMAAETLVRVASVRGAVVPSMGPRHDGRGDARLGEPCEAPCNILQWGRGTMAAETPAWPASRRPGCSPSMGPRHDGRGDLDSLHGPPLAAIPSMGPRHDGRGDGPIEAGPGEVLVALQWGRGTMAAETRMIEASKTVHGLPSMGPRHDGRGDERPATQHGLGEEPSMGPRHDGRGDARCISPDLPAVSSFNGAAARWPRRPVLGSATRGSSDRLPSMGPRHDGRGDSVVEGTLLVFTTCLQWGRGTMAAETARLESLEPTWSPSGFARGP